jgi:RNA ligase (TIGR02306 family)
MTRTIDFPRELPKTDQPQLEGWFMDSDVYKKDTWSVTEKLNGLSCTFYLNEDGEFHVCSQNRSLKDDNKNSFWALARKFKVEDIMRRNSMKGMAILGEMIGANVQGNQYCVKLDFYVYNMYNVCTEKYLLPVQLKAACKRLNLKHVPFLSENTTLDEKTVQDVLDFAEGKSMINGSDREGVVFFSNSKENISFKVVSNSWLIENE